jgi:hypothetical protein
LARSNDSVEPSRLAALSSPRTCDANESKARVAPAPRSLNGLIHGSLICTIWSWMVLSPAATLVAITSMASSTASSAVARLVATRPALATVNGSIPTSAAESTAIFLITAIFGPSAAMTGLASSTTAVTSSLSCFRRVPIVSVGEPSTSELMSEPLSFRVVPEALPSCELAKPEYALRNALPTSVTTVPSLPFDSPRCAPTPPTSART